MDVNYFCRFPVPWGRFLSGSQVAVVGGDKGGLTGSTRPATGCRQRDLKG